MMSLLVVSCRTRISPDIEPAASPPTVPAVIGKPGSVVIHFVNGRTTLFPPSRDCATGSPWSPAANTALERKNVATTATAMVREVLGRMGWLALLFVGMPPC